MFYLYIIFHSVKCQRGERWVGGEFISAERIVVYSDDGKAYLYKLPTNCIVESKEFQNRSKTQSGGGRMVIINIILITTNYYIFNAYYQNMYISM